MQSTWHFNRELPTAPTYALTLPASLTAYSNAWILLPDASLVSTALSKHM